MKKDEGFTLVELSIVLVILGLLVGGVLSGQSLIHAAQLRSVSSDYERFTSATNTFKDKYFSLPGDMSNATQFWGYAGAGVSGCVTNSGAGTTANGTCDGNGDGYVTYGSSSNSSGEAFQAWKQMALAGLIEGTYTGTDSNGPYDYGAGFVKHNYGVNSPKSKMSNLGWSYSLMDASSGYWPFQFPTDYRNWLSVGIASNGGFPMGGFKPEDSWNIDTKMDDGKPGTGSVQSNSNNAGCASSNTPADATYLLTETNVMCMLIMK